MSAGELNKTVLLKMPVVSRDASGSKETTYQTSQMARANIERTDSRRAIEKGATVLLNTDRVTIRQTISREAITEDWLVSYDGKDHGIANIDTKNRFITLTTKNDG